MLEVPQVMHTDAGDGEAFGQMVAHGLHPFADARAGAQQAAWMGYGHAFTWRHDDQYGMPLGQQRLADGVDDALVGGDCAGEAGHQVVEQLDTVRAGGQEGIGCDHARACDAQAQLEALVVELLGRAVPIVGARLEAVVAPAVGVAADGQRERADHLHGIGGLPTDNGQALLSEGFLYGSSAGGAALASCNKHSELCADDIARCWLRAKNKHVCFGRAAADSCTPVDCCPRPKPNDQRSPHSP